MLAKLAYTLLTVVLFAVLVEAGLYAAGVGGGATNLSRGFDSDARYVLPDPDRPGGYVTSMFDGSVPEVVIPPRDDRYRILLFGGSNTAGFPQGRLQQALNRRAAREGGPQFEVVKLGRAGYGSERVRILFEQALEVLEPDAVLIYSGHNEFIEMGFEMDLDAARSGSLLAVTEVASKLRLFQAFAEANEQTAEEIEEEGLAALPAAWQWEHEKFHGYTYDATLERLEAYRANLTFMCELALERDVEVVLSTVVGNMMAAPFIDNPGSDADADDVAWRDGAVAELEEALPERYRGVFFGTRLNPKHWKQRADHPGVQGEVPLLRAMDAPLDRHEYYYADPSGWHARVEPFLGNLAGFHARDFDEAERAALERARVVLEEGLERFPDDPTFLFQAGLIDYLFGDLDRARRRLRDAGRYDRAPRRASDATNDIVRDVAEAHPDVRYFDAEGLFHERAPEGIIGFEIMQDECHFHDAVLPLLMLDFSEPFYELATAEGDDA